MLLTEARNQTLKKHIRQGHRSVIQEIRKEKSLKSGLSFVDKIFFIKFAHQT
jgi:hypothetical protein